MIYNKIKTGEEEIVKKLWKQEQEALGIPYMTDIKDYVADDIFYCIRNDDNQIVAYCTYDIMKSRPEVRISALLVAPEYRGKGYSKELIYKCYKENDNLINKLGYRFIAEAKEGVANNTFYDKISFNMTRSPKKTCVIRTYDIDTNIVETWGPDKWEQQ